MTLKSKLLPGLLLCSMFNQQAQGADLIQVNDLNLGLVTSKKVIADYEKRSVRLEFTIAQLRNMRALLKKNPDGVILFDKADKGVDYQACPTVNIDANKIQISTNWLGVPKYYKLSNISDDYIQKITEARCAIVPIDTAKAMYSRAIKVMFPDRHPTNDR